VALPVNEALRPGLWAAAEGLSLPLNDLECDALLAYLALLQRWNATYNLTAVRDPAQMLTQHLADCLAVIQPLRREAARATTIRILDVGSGGGLPGVVIAILNPTHQITCVDSVGKKAAFVQQVAAELQLRNLQAAHTRVEQLRAEPFDIVTSRAFASLTDFTSLTGQHLAMNGCWAAMKGRAPAEELAALPAAIEVFHVEQLAVPGLDAERCMVWMRPNR
jgi:16S rRNA (guanine527-N7)-methyltransferase